MSKPRKTITAAATSIAHILPWPTVGGTEQATLRIAQAVADAGFRNVAFYLKGASPVRDLFAAAGFETLEYEGVEPSYRHPRAFLQASFQRAQQFKQREIDLIHCSDMLAGQYAAVSGRMARLLVL